MQRNKIKAKTKAELARIFGVHRSTVTRWIQHDDWPFRKSGPWDAEAVLDWHETFILSEFPLEIQDGDDGDDE